MLQKELTAEKLEAERAIFNKLGVMGGPTHPLEWYADKTLSEDKLYEKVKEVYDFVSKSLEYHHDDDISP